MPSHSSGQPAHQQIWYRDMRRRLRPLLKNKRLGFPAFESYCEAWEQVGFRPGKLTIAATALAGLIGRDVRRVRDWILAWQRFNLVDLIDYETATGTYHLYVYEPERAFEPTVDRAPPQAELPFGEAAAETPLGETAAESRRNRRAQTGQISLFPEVGETAAESPYMHVDIETSGSEDIGK